MKGKEDTVEMHPAIPTIGSSTFSREVAITCQKKSRKNNGKQRQVSFDLLIEALQDNYDDKALIRNAYCVAHVTMAKPQPTA